MARMLTKIPEAREFMATQPRPQLAATVHWLDQGSSRLADRASIRQLQVMWREAEDNAFRLLGSGKPVELEATRLFRLALAMAIVAKEQYPIRLPVEP